MILINMLYINKLFINIQINYVLKLMKKMRLNQTAYSQLVCYIFGFLGNNYTRIKQEKKTFNFL